MTSTRHAVRSLAAAALLAVALAGCTAQGHHARTTPTPASTTGDPSPGPTGGAPVVREGADAVVPAGFPSELPLPDGLLVVAVEDPSGWRLEYRLDDPARATELLERLLDDPDYVVDRDTELGERRLVMLSGARFDVSLDFGPQDGAPFLRYLVLPVA